MATDTETFQQLQEIPQQWGQPPEALVSHLVRKTKTGDITLDYLDHAQTTAALIAIDPLWTWEPMATDEHGKPHIFSANGQAHLWIWLTVLGKRLPAVGTAEANKSDCAKELIGDAIRNGAMRFGVALGLWSKQESLAMAEAPEAESLPTGGPELGQEQASAMEVAEGGQEPTEALREGLRARLNSLPPASRGTLRAEMDLQHISLNNDHDLARILLLVQQTESHLEEAMEAT